MMKLKLDIKKNKEINLQQLGFRVSRKMYYLNKFMNSQGNNLQHGM